jgi:enamine deaminase RidA (YjgF/YER057c/UK114 family)
MHVRNFRIGDEAALHQVFLSAIHGVAINDYTLEQVEAWAPRNLDPVLWADRMRGIAPFVAEIDGKPIAYADVQASGYIDHFFVSGTTARPPHLEANAYAQMRAAIATVAAALSEAGAELRHVVRTVVYAVDLADADHIARAHQEAFGASRPASTLVQVARLTPVSALVEIEVTAFVHD